MGQGASQPERHGEGRTTTRLCLRRRSTSIAPRDSGQRDRLLNHPPTRPPRSPPPPPRERPASINRLSQLFHMDTAPDALPPEPRLPRAGSMLHRTRSTFRDILHHRESTRSPMISSSRPPASILHHRSSYVRTGGSNSDLESPTPRLPSIDLSSTFEQEHLGANDREVATSSSTSTNRPAMRLNPFRPDRSFRRLASLRRRRSPPPALRTLGGLDDQAVMLSRLLSVAAAATAATLMGDDPDALNEARDLTGGTSVGEAGGNGEDGSFDGFLRALQNGRIASALRAGTDGTDNNTEGAPAPSLNFFRMFRFGSAPTSEPAVRTDQTQPSAENNEEHRMVPIIIVGIRSISSNASENGEAAESDLPPFINALGNFPSPIPTHAFGHGHNSIDAIIRPPQNETSFRHRRRASMGALGMGRNRLSDRMDDQRDHRSPERRRERPWSMASSNSTLEPRPPPATPASPSPELSRISSRHSTPNHSRPASLVANSTRDLGSDSRQNSILHRSSAASPLSSHTEETPSLRSTHSNTNLLAAHDPNVNLHIPRRSDVAPNVHFPRFASGHPRRNGVVEPDHPHLPPLSRASTSAATDSSSDAEHHRNSSSADGRSWIIYVLGGSYPENHPILTTPSLFTDSPTYEDMLLLSALLGPAKAPVASQEDVQSAGGLYTIQRQQAMGSDLSHDIAKTVQLVAVAVSEDREESRVLLEIGQRCLVCLCDFELDESARKLRDCGHLFHRECIDQWLTQGRNSCPLCRGQGVQEKEKASNLSAPAASPSNTAAAAAAASATAASSSPSTSPNANANVSRPRVAPPFPHPDLDFSEEPSFASI